MVEMWVQLPSLVPEKLGKNGKIGKTSNFTVDLYKNLVEEYGNPYPNNNENCLHKDGNPMPEIDYVFLFRN